MPLLTSSGSGPITVAIDGPSGSGKSSVSRAVATELSLRYLDTGAMFRALTLWCLRRGIDVADQAPVLDEAERMPLRIGTDPADPAVWLAEERVDDEIRTAAISAQVSAVATNPGVRTILADKQRQIIASARREVGGIVVEGRDITTVVAPEAEHRILLSANEQARLHRRGAELAARGEQGEANSVRDQVVRRDRDDSTVSQFMTPADGVDGIDTSLLTFTESVAAVLQVVGSRAPDTHARGESR
ncbi:MAG: (d)CMP kinase [Ornithinimicrobium sp.]